MTIQEARKTVGAQLGFVAFDGTPAAYKALSQAEQVQLTEQMALYITRNPSEFTAFQVKRSTAIVNAPGFGSPLQDTSYLSAIGDFATEYASGVESKFTKLLYTVAIVAVIVAILPTALAWGQRAKSAGKAEK